MEKINKTPHEIEREIFRQELSILLKNDFVTPREKKLFNKDQLEQLRNIRIKIAVLKASKINIEI